MRTTEMVLIALFLKTSKFIPACISIYIYIIFVKFPDIFQNTKLMIGLVKKYTFPTFFGKKKQIIRKFYQVNKFVTFHQKLLF